MTGRTITTTDLGVGYGRTHVLEGVNLDLGADRIHGLLGRNGTGKTTLLSAVASLRRPSRGTLRIDGEDPFENERLMEQICLIRESGDVLVDEPLRTNLDFFEDARPIEQAAPQFAHWREFFAKALHRDMEARFQSAQQMRDALDSVATQGRMPEPKFGGDSTAVSPAALPLAAGAVRACDVQVVSPQPRAVRLNWVFAVALVSLMLGFVGGFMVAGQ